VGVSLLGVSENSFLTPVMLGVASGLVVGKLVGVIGACFAAIKWVGQKCPEIPSHFVGVAFLCGIGFNMSLFIALLAAP